MYEAVNVQRTWTIGANEWVVLEQPCIYFELHVTILYFDRFYYSVKYIVW